ncbi:MAG: branched-chain amino acid ABC transporter permease [Anaerolineae bacterium]
MEKILEREEVRGRIRRDAISFWLSWGMVIILPLILVPILANAGILNPYYNDILIRIVIWVMLSAGYNLINGFSGQFSIGHCGFMAIGAYVAALLTTGGNPGYAGVTLRDPPLLSLLQNVHLSVMGYAFPLDFLPATILGGIAAALVAFLIGIPAFRARGDYLCVITLAFNMIIVNIFQNLEYVGGSRGQPGIKHYTTFAWAWLWMIVCIVVIRNLILSAHGRAIMAVRDNEVAAELGGVDTLKYKLVAFATGAFFAGVAGALLGHHMMFINPNLFTIFRSFDVLIVMYLGGEGSITGSIFGAVIWILLIEVLRNPMTAIGIPEWRLVIGPLLLIVLMIMRPRGLLGGIELPFIIRRERKGGER